MTSFTMADEISRNRATSWWRHQMETFSALLAICAGNSSVPSEFPTQRPVTRSCDVFFDLRLNKRLSKQSWGWLFETILWSWLYHCNVSRAKTYISSVGLGFSRWEVSMCIVQLFFVRRQAFSVAVCKAGYSTGVLFWSKFTQYTIAKDGYRGALVVMAGIHLHGYAIAAIFRAPNF